MSTTNAMRIPVVACGECHDAFDHVQWDALTLLEKREPIGSQVACEVRECMSCAHPIVVPCNLLADAREGYLVATERQYEDIYPETARGTVKPRGVFRRMFDALRGS